MNAQSIWVGNWYAWCRYGKPRGVTFTTSGVKKVRALKLIKEKDYRSERATTYVSVEDEDGRIYQARARDILSFWDDYEVQLRQKEREREQREAEQRERKEKHAADVKEMNDLLHTHEITGYVGTASQTVNIPYDEFRKVCARIG